MGQHSPFFDPIKSDACRKSTHPGVLTTTLGQAPDREGDAGRPSRLHPQLPKQKRINIRPIFNLLGNRLALAVAGFAIYAQQNWTIALRPFAASACISAAIFFACMGSTRLSLSAVMNRIAGYSAPGFTWW